MEKIMDQDIGVGSGNKKKDIKLKNKSYSSISSLSGGSDSSITPRRFQQIQESIDSSSKRYSIHAYF